MLKEQIWPSLWLTETKKKCAQQSGAGITKTRRRNVQDIATENEKNENTKEMKSMQGQERATQKIVTVRHESRTKEGLGVSHIAVSEQQFREVRMEQLTSINLLNSSGNVLLSAMNSMIPPEGSERVMGEYTAQGVRQIAKSICDIVQTKANVVRQMYAISRDEF